MSRKLLVLFVLVSFLVLSGCNIEGKIVSYDGEGLGGVTVLLSGDTTAQVITDSDGNYVFTDLEQGNYVITPTLDNFTFSPESKSVTISDYDVTGVDFSAVPDNLILVPQDYPTLQDAVNASVEGSIILVADGIYSGPGNFNVEVNKAVVIRSINGPQNTTIDCQQEGRGFYLRADATLSGLTITNGSHYKGGAILGSNAISPIIKDCVISNNYGRDSGGGISLMGGYPRIENCVIKLNTTDGYGGGVSFDYGLPELTNSEILENHAQRSGGGIYANHSSITIQNCIVNINRSEISGGGASLSYGDKKIINSLFAENMAAGQGLALDLLYGSCLISNDTFVGNTSINESTSASGLNLGGSADTQYDMFNTIVWGNDGNQMTVAANVQLLLAYSDVGQEGFTGEGVINVDPLFADDSYHLSAESPCIDTGMDSGVEIDLDDVSRPQGASYDMGAYEFVNN